MFQEYLVSSKTAGSGSPWPPLSKFCPFPCACKSLKVFFFSNPVVFHSLLVRYCLPIIVFSLNYPGGEAIKTLHSLKVKFHDILCLQNKSLLFSSCFTGFNLPCQCAPGCIYLPNWGVTVSSRKVIFLNCWESNGFIIRHDWSYSKAENLTVEELSGFSHLLVEGSHRYTLQLR